VNQFPSDPEYPFEAILNYYENSRDIRKRVFITGVNNTGKKLLTRVNNTGDKFIAGVVDTGEQLTAGVMDTSF
jgi:hypothetical protein